MQSVKILMIMSFAAVFLFFSGPFDRAEALLEAHECSFCHDFHGNPGYSGLLIAENSELVCLSCHTVSINDTAAAEVHNPVGLASDQPGYITCRECHDAHSSSASNVKMVGYKRDAQNWSESFTAPGIRKELPSTVSLTYNVVTFTGSTDFNIASAALIGACEVCHDPNHNDGNDCTACHSHSGGFLPSGGSCIGCHDGTDVNAPVVTYNSTHSKNTIFSTTTPDEFDCVDCHSGHNAGTIEIPNNTVVGIDYSLNGESGISLGSGSVSGATEAEICWNCHDTYGVSEWGLNIDTNGAGNNYNSGSLSGVVAPAWVNTEGATGATWTSAQALFAYKTGNIQSTHSVNNSATLPGLDPVANIRCSYCHDVHELNVATGDSTSGKPYLRGSWQGNPYREDGAPSSSQSYASQGNFGQVPRGGTGATEMGGYQIDQNNGDPTSGWTLGNSAGICILCHTEDDGGNSVTVNTMNYFDTASDDWVGTNGHSNAVIGGTGSGASNIFTESDRKPTDDYCNPTGSPDKDGLSESSDGYCAGYPNMAYQQHNDETSLQAWGFRSIDADGFSMIPSIVARYAYNNTYEWGATVDTGTTDTQYHEFSCSKCHNPHASRLPRLMITNCLDTKHNTWDDSPATMTKEDPVYNTVTISNSACYNNQTFDIEALDMKNDWILFPSSSFANDCDDGNKGTLTLTWRGTAYNTMKYAFKNNARQITVNSTTYTYDVLELPTVSDFAQFRGRQVPSAPSSNGNDASYVYADNSGVTLSNATSSQNCHRLADPDFSNAGGSGWNNVTPWTP